MCLPKELDVIVQGVGDPPPKNVEPQSNVVQKIAVIVKVADGLEGRDDQRDHYSLLNG